jgi:hypothetical protein
MPRSSQSPDGGLAARTGWIGSLARFWQVIFSLLLSIGFFTDFVFVEDIRAGLPGFHALDGCIFLGTSSSTAKVGIALITRK